MDLFNALNTGHEGGCGTLHANRPQDIPARIEALALLAGVSREAVHSQASAALRIAIHLDRNEFGRRYLQSIAVVRRRNAVGPVQTTLALSFDQAGQIREWPGYPQLCDELGQPLRLTPPRIESPSPLRRINGEPMPDFHPGMTPRETPRDVHPGDAPPCDVHPGETAPRDVRPGELPPREEEP